MLFNSYIFIFLFVPVSVGIFYYLAKKSGKKLAVKWVVLCSLFFYGYWNPVYLWFMGASLFTNYVIGKFVYKSSKNHKKAFWLTFLGIVINLGFLGYFKYANFVVNAFNQVKSSGFELAPIALPLAISFFTFEQIAYLVDAYKKETKDYSLFEYLMFITFFPQLIAGPIAHHSEILPQIEKKDNFVFSYKNLTLGISIFFIGLCKKTFLADGLSQYVIPVFERAKYSEFMLGAVECWAASISYSFQLYFDFSGYSDMAIGLACLFGIKLPINFESPYKSANISDFWRRWHMTLSRFLKDYLYIPLGGNKTSKPRHFFNLWITLFLGGIWHGAGWTFVFWGAMHATMLVMHKTYKMLFSNIVKVPKKTSIFITFILINFTMVAFRAENFDVMKRIYLSMFGKNGFDLRFIQSSYFDNYEQTFFLVLSGVIIWLAPNTRQIMGENFPALYIDKYNECEKSIIKLKFKLNYFWVCFICSLAMMSFLSMAGISEFLYFQF